MEQPNLTLLACQINVPETRSVADRDEHLRATTDRVAAALSEMHADLIVLPELSSVEYSREAFECLDVLAEPLDGPSVTAWSKVARRFRTTIVFGMPRVSSNGYCISQVVVGSDGDVVGTYDKIHVAQFGASMEKEFFECGSGVFVFEVKGVRIAPIICYDIRFPELIRTLCLDKGADLILHCGAYARDPSFYSWREFVVTRALENQVYVLSLNRAGSEFGASMFCPPWIDNEIPAPRFGDLEEFRRFDIDRVVMSHARRTYPFLSDRREDYRTLG